MNYSYIKKVNFLSRIVAYYEGMSGARRDVSGREQQEFMRMRRQSITMDCSLSQFARNTRAVNNVISNRDFSATGIKNKN